MSNFYFFILNRLRKFICIWGLLVISTTAAAGTQYFDIWEYQVKGNSLLESATIQRALTPYLGEQKSLQTVEQARDNLQSIYKSHGYLVTVNIPQQNVIGGVVQLDVIEGKIDRLKISGNKYFSRRELRNEVPSLKPGNALNMQQVRHEIDVANRSNPNRSIVPVIRPGRYPGTMEMELKIKDELPLHGFVEMNNRYTANTTKMRLMGGVSYDHLWQKHHSISLNYQMSPQDTDEVAVLNMTYAMPVGETSRLVFYGVKSDSQVATVTGQGDDLTVLGNGSIYGIRSINPLPNVELYYHSLILGVDYKDFGETQNIANEDDESGLSVPITYAGWSLSYNGTFNQPIIKTQYTVTGNFGLRSVNDAAEFEEKRFGAKANYFYVGLRFSQFFQLSEDFTINYGLQGQFTQSPLISNEQFSAGGIDTVRGYIESSAQGDNALTGSVELNYQVFSKTTTASIQDMRLNLFIDSARLRTIDALPNAEGEINSTTDLMGAGIGLTMRAFDNTSLRLYYAEPLKKLKSDSFVDEARVHFNLVYEFN